MFCDSCGTQLQTDQRFCSSCGKPVGIAMVPRQTSRVAEHRQLLGILWLVYSAFSLIGGTILYVLAHTLFAQLGRAPSSPEFPGGLAFLQPLMTVISVIILTKAGLCIAAGIGLLQRQPWGRIVAIVAAFIALINIPFGMALGIYTIWALMSANAEDQYEKLSLAA